MVGDLVLLVMGFVLTTVVGSFLGAFLQRRSWAHQNDERLREDEHRRAADTCRALSTLLDKRLYRMLRLSHAIAGYGDGSITEDILQKRFQDYDDVLFEWNDGLNLRLAVVGTYFGASARNYLDFQVYEDFKSAGDHLEDAYRQVRRGTDVKPNTKNVTARLTQLNDEIYQLTLFMNAQLREGQLGRAAPEPLGAPILEARHPR